MKLEESHSLPLEEAQQRLKLLVDHWGKKAPLQVVWNGPAAAVSGKAMGVKIEATIRVEANKIIAEGTDPGLLFRSAAINYLKRKFAEYFDPKVSLASLTQKTSD
jgi:hypothetical protein